MTASCIFLELGRIRTLRYSVHSSFCFLDACQWYTSSKCWKACRKFSISGAFFSQVLIYHILLMTLLMSSAIRSTAHYHLRSQSIILYALLIVKGKTDCVSVGALHESCYGNSWKMTGERQAVAAIRYLLHTCLCPLVWSSPTLTSALPQLLDISSCHLSGFA